MSELCSRSEGWAVGDLHAVARGQHGSVTEEWDCWAWNSIEVDGSRKIESRVRAGRVCAVHIYHRTALSTATPRHRVNSFRGAALSDDSARPESLSGSVAENTVALSLCISSCQ